MSDKLQEVKIKIDRLELMLTILIMNEMAKGDPKFMQLVDAVIKEKPSGYFDDLWEKYKSFISEESYKISHIDVLNERINIVDKLFNELKNSAEEFPPKEKKK